MRGAKLRTTQIVLSTCHGAGSRQLNNMNFDVCIIDEVSDDSRRLIRALVDFTLTLARRLKQWRL